MWTAFINVTIELASSAAFGVEDALSPTLPRAGRGGV